MSEYSYIPCSERVGPHIQEKTWIISADLGQANDYTAISIIQRIVTGYGVLGADKRGEKQLLLRHIERIRDVPYPEIVDRIKTLYKKPALQGEKAVVIDFTGLGRPVFDMMEKAGFHHSMCGVNITGGTDVTYQNRHYNVPKRELVSTLQIQLQNGVFRIAKGLKEANALIEEMANFQTTITAAGNDTYNGRTGVHDDIVMSVAMGVWLGSRNTIRHWGNDKYM